MADPSEGMLDDAAGAIMHPIRTTKRAINLAFDGAMNVALCVAKPILRGWDKLNGKDRSR